MTAAPPLHTARLDRVEAWCRRRFVILLLCILGALAAYAPALGGGLVWDDTYLVGENPFFKSPIFFFESFRHWLFFDSFSTYYRPVQNWSYLLDYWLWRGNTAGYHLTNIALHATAGFLLCVLLQSLLPAILKRDAPALVGRSSVTALFIALLWVVHPVHNAAVAYISGRADSLAAVFALLAWLLALRAEEARTRGSRAAWSAAAGGTMLVALCAKEIALMWLVLFLAHRWCYGRSGLRGKVVVTGAVLVVLASYALLHSLPAPRVAMEDAPPAPLAARTLLMLRALGDYTGLMFYPAKLYMERSLAEEGAYRSAAFWRTHARGEWLSLIGLLALLGAGWLCRWRAPGRALRIAGAAWFGIAFLPISNLFPLNAEVAEHWIYLASIGFLILLAGTVLAWPPRTRRGACAVAMLAIVALGSRTAVRSGDWVDAETFCLRTMRDGGASPRILGTLAGIYGRRGDWPKQEQVLRRTLERFPDFTPARIQLGICLAKQGRAPEAERALDLDAAKTAETSRRFPRTWPAALNLAKLRHDAGDRAAALAVLSEARTQFPETWEIVRYESELLQEAGDGAAAGRGVEHFAAEHWWHLDAWLTLGRLRFASGDLDGALIALEQASRLDLYDGRPLAGIAQIELDRQHGDAALAAQCAAVARAPDRPAHYLELSAILEKLGRPAEAGAALRQAQRLAANADKP
jgi:tetratricopeptide (TPR) repeat protein